MAIEAHKSRLEDLVRTKPAPIGSLPPEIIFYVLELADFPFCGYRIRELSRVSRAWRGIILSFPNFWSNIDLHPSWPNMSLLRCHVARSRQYPLRISIQSWSTPAELSSFIDVIVPYIHRWRTLDIRMNSRECMQVILDKINHLKFPSLLHTTIVGNGNVQYPTFLRPENAPSLKSLELWPLIPMDDFPTGQIITNLSLRFLRGRFRPMALPLVLQTPSYTLRVEDTEVVFSVFPNLHHVEIRTVDMPLDLFRTNVGGIRPADDWEVLKSLTLRDMTICSQSPFIEDLAQWLEQRKLAGRPMLNVVFTGCQFLFNVDQDLRRRRSSPPFHRL